MMPARERIRRRAIVERIVIDVTVPGIETVEPCIGTAIAPVGKGPCRPDMPDAGTIIVRAQISSLRGNARGQNGKYRDRADYRRLQITDPTAIHLSPTGSMICH